MITDLLHVCTFFYYLIFKYTFHLSASHLLWGYRKDNFYSQICINTVSGYKTSFRKGDCIRWVVSLLEQINTSPVTGMYLHRFSRETKPIRDRHIYPRSSRSPVCKLETQQSQWCSSSPSPKAWDQESWWFESEGRRRLMCQLKDSREERGISSVVCLLLLIYLLVSSRDILKDTPRIMFNYILRHLMAQQVDTQY